MPLAAVGLRDSLHAHSQISQSKVTPAVLYPLEIDEAPKNLTRHPGEALALARDAWSCMWVKPRDVV